MKQLNKVVNDAIINRLSQYYGLTLFKPHLRNNVHLFKQDIIDYNHIVHFNINLPLSYLFLTKNKHNNQCLLITNSVIYECFQRFKDYVYDQDILLVGYYYPNTKQFLVLDLVISNNVIERSNIIERIQKCNMIMYYDYIYDPILSSFDISVLDYVEYNFIESLVNEHLPKLSYNNVVDGLVFVPTDRSQDCIIINLKDNQNSSDSQLMGINNNSTADNNPKCDVNLQLTSQSSRNEELSITDSPKCTSANFLVKSTELSDVYELYLRDSKFNLHKYDTAGVPDATVSTYLRELFLDKNQHVMKCVYNKDFKRWVPKNLSKRDYCDPYNYII